LLDFSLASIIPQVFKPLSFIYQQKYVTLYKNIIIKGHEKYENWERATKVPVNNK
jgi:hypothetical protein